MSLRRQLLLVAVMALALPWAGCQYVKEMEFTLRQGQILALKATAQAVSSRISADPTLMSSLEQSSSLLSPQLPELAYYAYPLSTDVSLDGYVDEWRHMGFGEPSSSDSILTNNDIVRVFMGERNATFYMCLEVKDVSRQFYSPVLGVSSSDHINVFLKNGTEVKQFRIFSAAPGIVSVEGLKMDGNWFREHEMSGVWNEKESSYFVELKMPLSWVKGGLSLQIWDGEKGALNNRESALNPLIIPDLLYEDVLSVFSRSGVKLHLVLPGGWILGKSGMVYESEDPRGAKTWVYWLVRKIIGQADYPELSLNALSGRLFELPITGTQEDVDQPSWYADKNRIIARVVAPILLSNGMSAAVVAEESTDSVEVLTTGAIGRLIFYSFLATALVALTLLSYASILSFRVRGLSRAAQSAVDMDGRILGVFTPSTRQDEIGELSRSYRALLDRLQSYNSYLESLSGKLSHELRTPLAIVSTSLDNLKFHALTSDAQVYMDRASLGAQRLSSILSAMSAATKVEQSIQHCEKERVDVATLLAQVVSTYQDLYQHCNIQLVSKVDAPFFMKVAPELLVQMFDKLVENAVDFTGNGGDILFEMVTEKNALIIRVINTGPPLPIHFQGQIFESLVSVRALDVDGSQDRQHHLGLGLYIVRLITQFHQGRVLAFNHQDGRRVVFEIVLPIV